MNDSIDEDMLDEVTRDDSDMSLMSAIDYVRELTCDVADCGRIYCVAINTLIKYALAEADHAADLLDGELTSEEIDKLLVQNAEVVKRVGAGDPHALASLFAAAGVTVTKVTVGDQVNNNNNMEDN